MPTIVESLLHDPSLGIHASGTVPLSTGFRATTAATIALEGYGAIRTDGTLTNSGNRTLTNAATASGGTSTTNGAGNLSFSAAQTFTGATGVSAGRLSVGPPDGPMQEP